MFDGKAFGAEIVDVVKGYVSKALEPVLKRLDAIESREPLKGDPGKDADPAEIERMVADAVAKAVAAIPSPKDGQPGKDADPEQVATMVQEAVQRAVDALPPPKDGKDAEPYEPDPAIIKAMVAEIAQPVLDAMEKPQDGKSVTIDEVMPELKEHASALISEAVKAIPVPKDGEPGRDGLDAVTPILKDGLLLFTMSDGSVKEVGRVDGKDGADGKPGADGLGFDDLEVLHDGERGFTFRFARGEMVKEFPFTLPVVIDRGVYREGDSYEKGDAVTWGGSVWIAQEDTAEKPDSGKGWRLSVKRGRDGKPGKDGELKTKHPVKVG